MKLKTLLSLLFIVLASYAFAQNNNIAYAITGDGANDFTWMNIRQINLATGQVSKTIFQHNKTNFSFTDAVTKKVLAQAVDNNTVHSLSYPTGSFVAAAAYDKRSNRLYFMPMLNTELRWLDLNIKNETPQFYSVHNNAFALGDMNDEANHITRMVIAADGNGYAVTNDANHLIKFTTVRTPVITDLGNIVDADTSTGISIHNKCSSWGGDMLADAFGKLYIISANHNVFVVDVNSRVATFKGNISGLPANYSTNGAAVDADGEIVVSSANVFEGYYKLKLSDLAAVKIEGSDKVFNASDLANGNLLLQKEADDANAFLAPSFTSTNDVAFASEKIFPNPVTASSFKVLLSGYNEGTYTIILSDIAGRSIQSNKINLAKDQQYSTINLLSKPLPGMYMVKMINDKQQIILTEKLMIQ
jgi:hypothetical protein